MLTVYLTLTKSGERNAVASEEDLGMVRKLWTKRRRPRAKHMVYKLHYVVLLLTVY